jgi:hypothetical protein
MATCCTGVCLRGEGCVAFPSRSTFVPPHERGTATVLPLTPEQVRQIVREELERAKRAV